MSDEDLNEEDEDDDDILEEEDNDDAMEDISEVDEDSSDSEDDGSEEAEQSAQERKPVQTETPIGWRLCLFDSLSLIRDPQRRNTSLLIFGLLLLLGMQIGQDFYGS